APGYGFPPPQAPAPGYGFPPPQGAAPMPGPGFPPPMPQGYGPTCRFCGSVPAVEATIRGHQGFLVIMRFLKLQGPFCRTCGIAAHRDMTSKSLWQGWWGIASAVINPITMLINIPQRSKINQLPPPMPGAPGTPMNPGKPIFARPGSWVLLLPVVLLVVAVIAGVTGAAQDPQYASVGDCIHNSGTSSNPDVTVVDCGSADADYKVVDRLSGTTDVEKCGNGATAGYYQEQGTSKFMLCLAPNRK
uniref:LppU/SCO3897 family protein n=1 Tax=Peterkaempfera griseoplana TaxID=66896 RepID=UPI000A7A504A